MESTSVLGRAFSHLWYVIYWLITGLAFVFALSPFIFFMINVGNLRQEVMADGVLGLVSLFPLAWEYLFSHYPLYAIVAAGFLVGSGGTMVLGGALRLVKPNPELIHGFGTWAGLLDLKEQARFAIWLTQNPAKNQYEEWMSFMMSMAMTAVIVMVSSTILYALYAYAFIFVYGGPLEGIWLAVLVLAVLTGMSFSAYGSSTGARTVYTVAVKVLVEEYQRENPPSSKE